MKYYNQNRPNRQHTPFGQNNRNNNNNYNNRNNYNNNNHNGNNYNGNNNNHNGNNNNNGGGSSHNSSDHQTFKQKFLRCLISLISVCGFWLFWYALVLGYEENIACFVFGIIFMSLGVMHLGIGVKKDIEHKKRMARRK